MRLERKSLIAVTILLMAGCSANRQVRQTSTAYSSPEPVQMPMRHADEYDSGADQYEYHQENTPPRSQPAAPPARPFPPAVPKGEPAQAPPAIGVSRVKSVSWLDGSGDEQTQGSSDVEVPGDQSSSEQFSYFPHEYCAEGCVTPTPRNLRCREKTTLLEQLRGWSLRRKTRRIQRKYTAPGCGVHETCSPGCFAPDGCTTLIYDADPSQEVLQQYLPSENTGPATKGHGNLAEPLSENGWNNPTATPDPRFTPDEMLELPSTLVEAPVDGPLPQPVPTSPMIEPMPVAPNSQPTAPEPPAAQQNPASPSPAPQPAAPDAVKNVVRPPRWHRLNPPAAAVSAPEAAPVIPADPSLPTIQPGRRI